MLENYINICVDLQEKSRKYCFKCFKIEEKFCHGTTCITQWSHENSSIAEQWDGQIHLPHFKTPVLSNVSNLFFMVVLVSDNRWCSEDKNCHALFSLLLLHSSSLLTQRCYYSVNVKLHISNVKPSAGSMLIHRADTAASYNTEIREVP